MPSLKEVKVKIGAVKSTAQITKAMNMVAAAKLRGAQMKMEDFRPYTAKFNATMGSLAGSMAGGNYPLMEARAVNTVELVVITSDRGLCGSFNSNILKLVNKLIKRYEGEGKKVSLVCVGKKGASLLRKTGKVRKTYTDIMANFQMFNARTIAQELAANFLAGEADEVQLVYGAFKSIGSQVPTASLLLPVQQLSEKDKGSEPKGAVPAYIYEPSSEEIMEVLLPLYLNVMVYHAMLEVGASEHAARMTAMDNATKACKDIIHNLTLIYNKARQAGITNELMDIVGGAEALKG
jgi:F-type H+-transporting ATPase subunit gamma